LKGTIVDLLRGLEWLTGMTGVAVLSCALLTIRRHFHSFAGRLLAIVCVLAGLGLIGLALYMGNQLPGPHGK